MNQGNKQKATADTKNIHAQLLLSHAGKQENNPIRKMNRKLNIHSKNDAKVVITYHGTKLSKQFQIKYQTKFEYRSDFFYFGKCPENDWEENYFGGTDRRISEVITDHNKRDKNSYILKHAHNKKHTHVWVKIVSIYWSLIITVTIGLK